MQAQANDDILARAARRNTAIFAKRWREDIDPAAHQFEMARRVDGPVQYQADFWPRDHGKSEIFCIGYPLRLICEDPNVRILIVQKTAGEAEKTVSVIKRELESNQPLKSFYAPLWREMVGHEDISNQSTKRAAVGQQSRDRWQQRRIYVRRKRRGKDPTIEAVGVGGAITGGHFDVIILDDVEDDENTRTEDRINSMINWFTGTIMQLREPHTKIVVVGTLKTNRRDIYRVLTESPVWDVHTIGAILSHPLDDIKFDLVRNENNVVVDVDVKTPEVQTLWPQKWSIKALLLEMVASLDRAVWIREKLNDLRALMGKIFNRENLFYFTADELREITEGPGFERTIQVWDTAWEENKDADWSVCITIGKYQGRLYVIDVLRAKLETPELELAIKSQYYAWRPSEICIEDAASGKSVIKVLQRRTGLPIVAIPTLGKDKVARARTATPYTQTGRVGVLAGAHWLPMFLDELTMFPDAEIDGQVDALVYGVVRLMLGDGEVAVSQASTVTATELFQLEAAA